MGFNGTGKLWTLDEVLQLRKLASEGGVNAAAKTLGRTPMSVRRKATKSGILFAKAPRSFADVSQ